MKIGSVALGLIAAVGISLSCVSLLTADQVKYMDKAGNIHFVKRPSDVPKEYLLQVYTPTPTPYYDKRALAEMKRKKAIAEADQRRAEMQKERDRRRQELLMQQEQAREARKMRAEDDGARLSRGGR